MMTSLRNLTELRHQNFISSPGSTHSLPRHRKSFRIAICHALIILTTQTFAQDDPLFTDQWFLHNTGQTIRGQIGVADADINAPEAWALFPQNQIGDRDYVIALLDQGIDYTHPDLSANIWINQDEIPANLFATLDSDNNGIIHSSEIIDYITTNGLDLDGDSTFTLRDAVQPGSPIADGIDTDGNTYVDDLYGFDFRDNDNDPMPNISHDTRNAGIIGGIGNNSLGITGINWQTSMLVCRINEGASTDLNAAINCLDYLVDLKSRGVNVVATSNPWVLTSFNQALYDAILRQQQAGILYIAPAGNSNHDNDEDTPFYPTSFDLDNIISVAAFNNRNLRGPFSGFPSPILFSSYGEHSVDISVPGIDLMSTINNGSYSFNSGTSFTTGVVAGSLALLKAYDPSLTWQRLKARLLASGIPAVDGRLRSKTLSGRYMRLADDNGLGALTCSGSNMVIQEPKNTNIRIVLPHENSIELRLSSLSCDGIGPAPMVTVRETGQEILLNHEGAGTYRTSWTLPERNSYTLDFSDGSVLNVLPVDSNFCQTAGVSEIPLLECHALVDLYFSTYGPGWFDSLDWLASNTPCSWKGITCVDASVQKIDLFDNNLQGYLPRSLADLSNLQVLDLSYNQDLYGRIPVFLRALENIQTFSYLDTEVCTWPDETFQSWLINIPNLQGFNIPCPNLSSGLNLHLPLNEGSGDAIYDDQSPNGHQGTVNGADWATGILQNALEFDGVDDFADITDQGLNSPLDFTGGDEITLSAWVKPTATGLRTILSKGRVGSTEVNYALRLGTSSTSDRFVFIYTSTAGDFQVWASSGKSATLDIWQHLAVTYKFTDPNSIRLYIDGVLQSGEWTSGNGFRFPAQSNEPLRLGAIQNLPGGPITEEWRGSLDDIRIYDYGVSRSTAMNLFLQKPKSFRFIPNSEIEVLQPGDSIPITRKLDDVASAAPPIGYWNFDEGNGCLAFDVSAGQNGELLPRCPKNGPSWVSSIRNKSLNFDGRNDYVDVIDPGDNSVLDFGHGETISIATWVKPTKNGLKTILSKGRVESTKSNYALRLGSGRARNQFTFYYRNAADTRFHTWTADDTPARLNEWQHITITYTFGKGDSFKMYVDGVQQSGNWVNGNGNDVPVQTNESLRFGAIQNRPNGRQTEMWAGSIDEVRIYNRGLSQTEIVELMQ